MGVRVSVAGSEVAVEVAARAGSPAAVASSGVDCEAGEQAATRNSRQVRAKVRARFILIPSDLKFYLLYRKNFYSNLRYSS